MIRHSRKEWGWPSSHLAERHCRPWVKWPGTEFWFYHLLSVCPRQVFICKMILMIAHGEARDIWGCMHVVKSPDSSQQWLCHYNLYPTWYKFLTPLFTLSASAWPGVTGSPVVQLWWLYFCLITSWLWAGSLIPPPCSPWLPSHLLAPILLASSYLYFSELVVDS